MIYVAERFMKPGCGAYADSQEPVGQASFHCLCLAGHLSKLDIGTHTLPFYLDLPNLNGSTWSLAG